MLRTLVRRAADGGKPQPVIPFNPFKTKKVWPPDFSRLSPQEQFKYEKKYKRRVKLLSARPKWTKMVKVTQLVSITTLVVYFVLFMDWNDEGRGKPFERFRQRFWGIFSSL